MPENKDHIDFESWDLHRAAIQNRVDIARALIDSGAEVDARNEWNEGGWTASQLTWMLVDGT